MNNSPGTNAGGRAGQVIPAPQSAAALPELYGSLAGYQPYTGATADGPELFGLNLFEIWRILNKRKWLILGIVAAVLIINGVRTLMQTPIYTATVRLQIDRPMKIVESGNDVVQQGSDWEFMKTQYELLGSYSMAERVAIALKLGAEADLFKPRQFSVFGLVTGLWKTTSHRKGKENDLQRAAAGVILGNVVVSPVPESRLIDVSYSDPVPQRAQRVANAYADAFVATNTDKRFQANAQAKLFLEDKIDQLKVRLEDSEK